MKISEKHKYALRVMAGVLGLSQSVAFERVVERIASELPIARNWALLWDEEEAVRMLNLYSLHEFKPTPNETARIAFLVTAISLVLVRCVDRRVYVSGHVRIFHGTRMEPAIGEEDAGGEFAHGLLDELHVALAYVVTQIMHQQHLRAFLEPAHDRSLVAPAAT